MASAFVVIPSAQSCFYDKATADHKQSENTKQNSEPSAKGHRDGRGAHKQDGGDGKEQR